MAFSDIRLSRRQFVQSSAAAIGAAACLHAGSSSGKPAVGQSVSSPVLPRAPLAEVPFVALPLGSVRARGWLLKQLELQRDGLTGYADKVLPSLTRDSSAWLMRGEGDGEGWEKGPYYAKGLLPLAYTLGDEKLIAKANEWVEAILASQRDNGFFGPKNNDDWWPRMVATYVLRDYAEATGDPRVADFLSRYYRHLHQELPNRPLREWGKARAGDEIDTVFWLYNRGGDAELLELADLLHDQAYPWREIYTENRFLDYPSPPGDFHPKHAVNVAQALKMPSVYWQRSGDELDRAAYRRGLEHLMRDHGTSYGINTGTEMVSGRSTVEGVELCAIVENMLSAETAMRILGEARIGDELELVAFNSLPAALSKDFRQHVYYTLANNAAATRGFCGYEIDYADCRTPAPRSGCPCCCYNLHMGWPKLVQNAWAGTPAGGLALLAYVPSEVNTMVTSGSRARVVCDTNYPFSEKIALDLDVDKTARFPLHLRIPAWCSKPELRINGKLESTPTGGEFVVVERNWSSGDRVELTFPMETKVIRGVNQSASVRRGPLVYSLAMAEHWKPFEKSPVPGFEPCEVTSATPWNYALVLDEAKPEESLEFESRKRGENPFATGKSPVAMRAKAKRLEGWKLRADGLMPLDPPVSPVVADGPLETIELVPFGSQMLRITDFPVVGKPSVRSGEFQMNFTDPALDGFIVYRGGFVRDGRLHLPRAAKAIATAADFADLNLEAELVVGPQGDAGAVFRVTEPSVGVDQYRGYYVGINTESQTVVIGKADYRWIPLAQQAAKVDPGRSHRLRVEARGADIRVFLDEVSEPVLAISDDSYTAGMVGVRSYSHGATFQSLKASSA